MKNLLLLVCLVLCVVELRAQEESFLFHGRVMSDDSLQPVANVNIVSKLTRYGTISNQEGFFIIKSKTMDTLWVSCVGFEPAEVAVNKDSILDNTLDIIMIRGNIMLDSVEIYPLPSYDDFIKDIAKMPLKKPYFVPGVTKDGLEELIYKRPVHDPKASSINPISLIYNRFNKREVLRRKLIKNRKRFNKEMQRIGADSLMIPE